jgi:hypothetical protein
MVEPATEGRTSGTVPVDPVPRAAAEPRAEPRGGAPGWLGRRATVVVLLLALAAGAWAVVGSRSVFPYLSDDHD